MKVLFPDTSLIASMEGVELRQGLASKRKKPVIVPEHPWEEIHTYLYGSVLKKDATYNMWYQSYVDGYGFFVNYAESRDGIIWEKPAMREFSFKKPGLYPTVAVDGDIKDFYSKKSAYDNLNTNIVSTYHIPSVIFDHSDAEAPYKLFGFTDKGYCVAFSSDGKNFKEYENNPVIPLLRFPNPRTRKTWFSDVAPVFRDTSKNRFAAFVKTYALDEAGRTRRCVGFSESDDFKIWSTPETIWMPDERDDALAVEKGFKWSDFYGLCGFNYGGIYLGFLWLFYIDYEVEKGTHEGNVEVYLASSNDGLKWRRFSDEPLIALSRTGWDTDMIYTANGPVFEKDKTLIYYGGSNFGHGIGHEEIPFDFDRHAFSIGLASLRKDGFVYAHSSEGGRFITKPMEFDRGYLTLNANTEHGWVAVEVKTREGGLKIFKMEGIDSVEHRIRTGLRGRLAVNVHINNAELYSLEAL